MSFVFLSVSQRYILRALWSGLIHSLDQTPVDIKSQSLPQLEDARLEKSARPH